MVAVLDTKCCGSYSAIDNWNLFTCVWQRQHNKPKSTWNDCLIHIFSEMDEFNGCIKRKYNLGGQRKKQKKKKKIHGVSKAHKDWFI